MDPARKIQPGFPGTGEGLSAKVPRIVPESGADLGGNLSRARHHVTFVLANENVRFAAESCASVLGSANTIFGFACYSWRFLFGLECLQKPVACSGDRVLVLVGDMEQPWLPRRDEIELLRPLMFSATQVCAIGAGVFIPVTMGYGKSGEIAVHQNFRSAIAELAPSCDVGYQPTSHTGTLRCAVSSAASPRMMVEMVSQQQGAFAGAALSEYLGLATTKQNATSDAHWRYLNQARGNQVVSAALDLMANSLEERLSICEIAEETCVSPRQLERSFQLLLRQSPLRIYRNLRLDRARRLVVQTRMSVLEISLACGFSSTANMAKWYRSRYGLLPTEDRKRAYCD